MIQYSGGTLVDTTSTPATRQDLVNLITDALSDAGWTAISGTPGSSADVTMETAAGNQGQKVRFRIFEPASGNCAQVTMKHTSGLPTSGISYILPNSVLWRVIANKFHFFAFMSGGAARATTRGYVAGGTLYVPSHLPLISGENIGWMQANGISDTDVSTRCSFRTTIRSYDNVNTGGRYGGLFQTNLNESTGWSVQTGVLGLMPWQGGYHVQDYMYRWHDDSAFVYEPLMYWGAAAIGDEAKIKGQLYDAMIVSGRYVSEYSLPFDSHTWRAITDNAATIISSTQTLFLAVS